MNYQILKYIPKKLGSYILDYGCGVNFPLRSALMENTRLGNYFYYDPKVNGSIPPIGDICDIVVCRHAAYYFEEPNEEFKKLYGYLKEDGLLVLEVINGASFTSCWVKQNDLQIKFIFNEISIREILEEVGFKDVKIYGDDFIATGIKSRLRGMALKIWHFVLKVIYLIERGNDERNPTIFTKNLFVTAKKPWNNF